MASARSAVRHVRTGTPDRLGPSRAFNYRARAIARSRRSWPCITRRSRAWQGRMPQICRRSPRSEACDFLRAQVSTIACVGAPWFGTQRYARSKDDEEGGAAISHFRCLYARGWRIGVDRQTQEMTRMEERRAWAVGQSGSRLKRNPITAPLNSALRAKQPHLGSKAAS